MFKVKDFDPSIRDIREPVVMFIRADNFNKTH